jgi:hypothetical protein
MQADLVAVRAPLVVPLWCLIQMLHPVTSTHRDDSDAGARMAPLPQLPPSYRAKNEALVAQLKRQQEEQEARRQQEQAFVAAVGAALKGKGKGSAAQWLQGPHAERIAALQVRPAPHSPGPCC